MNKDFNPIIVSADIVLAATTFVLFAKLDDPNSWTGLGFLAITWLFTCSVIMRLKGDL